MECLNELSGKRGCTAAFADDIGMVVDDILMLSPQLANVFQEFSVIFALTLNLSKTVAIPLWRMASPDHIQRLLKE
eukprot:1607686-Karenia_brevis.AAC.1